MRKKVKHSREKKFFSEYYWTKKVSGEIEKKTNFTLKFIKKYIIENKMLVWEKLEHFSNN